MSRELIKKDMINAIKQCGVPVIYGVYSSCGIKNYEPTEVLPLSNSSYAVQSNTLTFFIIAGTLGKLTSNTRIYIDGKEYILDRFIIVNNGLQEKLWLIEA